LDCGHSVFLSQLNRTAFGGRAAWCQSVSGNQRQQA